VRNLALFLSWVFVVVSALAALWMVFAAWFPYENLSSEELHEDDWLAVAGPTLLVLAGGTLVFVMKRRPIWAALAYTAYAIVGFLALRFALINLSDRSDTALVVFALSIGIVGLLAVTASFDERRPPPHSSPH